MTITTATATVRLIDQAGEHRPMHCRADAIADVLLLHWFVDPPREVADAIHALQAALVASQRYGEFEQFLGVKIEPADNHDATDVGAAPQPPAWCAPGAEPDWARIPAEHGGGLVGVWERKLDGCDVWISCEDQIVGGRVLRSAPRIFGTEEPRDGWTAEQALELAAQLVAAVDLIGQAAAL